MAANDPEPETQKKVHMGWYASKSCYSVSVLNHSQQSFILLRQMMTIPDYGTPLCRQTHIRADGNNQQFISGTMGLDAVLRWGQVTPRPSHQLTNTHTYPW